MSDDGKKTSPGKVEISPEGREAFKRRAAEIGKRLDEVKSRHEPDRDAAQEQSGRSRAFSQGLRIATDLFAGVAVGLFIGWGLDQLLGTNWLIVVFLLVGVAAGLLNVIRTARRLQAESEPLQRKAPSVKDDDEDK